MDDQVVGFAHKIGLKRVLDLVTVALARFDPEQAARRAKAARDGRGVWVDDETHDGTRTDPDRGRRPRRRRVRRHHRRDRGRARRPREHRPHRPAPGHRGRRDRRPPGHPRPPRHEQHPPERRRTANDEQSADQDEPDDAADVDAAGGDERRRWRRRRRTRPGRGEGGARATEARRIGREEADRLRPGAGPARQAGPLHPPARRRGRRARTQRDRPGRGRRPGPGRPGHGLARPHRPAGPAGARPRRQHPRRRLRDPAPHQRDRLPDLPLLPVPVVQQPDPEQGHRPHQEIRPTRRRRPTRPDPARQPRQTLPPAPPAQDPRRLDLPDARTRPLPLAITPRPPLPRRLHRHHQPHHPRRPPPRRDNAGRPAPRPPRPTRHRPRRPRTTHSKPTPIPARRSLTTTSSPRRRWPRPPERQGAPTRSTKHRDTPSRRFVLPERKHVTLPTAQAVVSDGSTSGSPTAAPNGSAERRAALNCSTQAPATGLRGWASARSSARGQLRVVNCAVKRAQDSMRFFRPVSVLSTRPRITRPRMNPGSGRLW